MPLSFPLFIPSFSTQWEHLPCVQTGTEISLTHPQSGEGYRQLHDAIMFASW